MRVLGIDAGGTKTVCLLADANGSIVSEARSAGANLQTAGAGAVARVLDDVIRRALDGAGVAPSATCVGVAGGDRARDITTMANVLRRLGFEHNVVIVNDALVALTAALGDDPGLVIVSGTGSIAYARDGRGRAARAGGWGYVVGDEGSGFWIGRAALTAVAHDVDGRGPHTLLTGMLPQALGVASPADLIPAVYDGGVQPAAIARLAMLVQRAADDHDPVARALIDRAATELAAAALAALDRLGMRESSFVTVLAGGAFRGMPSLRREVQRRMLVIAPGADVRSLDVEPARGAVWMALAHARGTLTLPQLV